MPTLRLLASSLVASALVLPAIGQSHPATTPAPLVATITSPTLFALDTAPATTTSPLSVPPTSFTFKPSKDAPKFDHIYVGKPFTPSKDVAADSKLHKINPAALAKAEAGLNALLERDRLHPDLMAQTQTACATLRSYNFTKRDLKSANPTPSSETDCTPLSKGHFLTNAPTSNGPTATSIQLIQVPSTPK